jgi:hypothetical protein
MGSTQCANADGANLGAGRNPMAGTGRLRCALGATANCRVSRSGDASPVASCARWADARLPHHVLSQLFPYQVHRRTAFEPQCGAANGPVGAAVFTRRLRQHSLLIVTPPDWRAGIAVNLIRRGRRTIASGNWLDHLPVRHHKITIVKNLEGLRRVRMKLRTMPRLRITHREGKRSYISQR